MINPENIFVADRLPTLALPAQRNAYVFGAAHPLGEALLNQVLASKQYDRVMVSTTAPLPATMARLHGVLRTQPFEMQDLAAAVDCIFIVDADADAVLPYRAAQASPRYGFAARSTVYAPLTASDIPVLLRSVSLAASAAVNMPMRWLIVAPSAAANVASSWVASYSAHLPCMVYGLNTGERGASHKTAYQFKPEGSTVLDRLGVWVLNTVSNIAHSMMNPQQKVPLTAVKTAQRLVAQFDRLDITPRLQLVTINELV